MRRILCIIICAFSILVPQSCFSQSSEILPGAYDTGVYLNLLQGKKVGVVANQASLINETHLIDSLLSLNIDVRKIYCPEHGFRGQAENGELLSDEIDQKTGLKINSIYGKDKKPSPEMLMGIDVMLFDLQDVGVRFYTYISTLAYVMEACAEQGISVVVLDRPNPNGFYVDGPLLKNEFKSFVGMHPVPIVYGMTIGEYGMMVNGEGWLKNAIKCDYKVVNCLNYDHNSLYSLPIKPSPNLPDMASIYLYPSLCLFEGTVVSIGRGTDYPFKCYGHPDLGLGSFMFTPKSIPGASLHPKHEGKACNGQNLTNYAEVILKEKKLNLLWIIESYKFLALEDDFFIKYFEKLAGTDQLRTQIKSGLTEEQIRETWKEDLDDFRNIRKQYLLYKDFE